MARPISDILTERDTNLAFGQFVDFLIDREALIGYNCLEQIEKDITHVTIFEFEVYNGGIDQFFGNHSGGFIPETIEALSNIGAKRISAFLESLLIKMKLLGLKDRDQRSGYFSDIPEDEDELIIAEIDTLMQEENVGSLCVEYFKVNKKKLKCIYGNKKKGYHT